MVGANALVASMPMPRKNSRSNVPSQGASPAKLKL